MKGWIACVILVVLIGGGFFSERGKVKRLEQQLEDAQVLTKELQEQKQFSDAEHARQEKLVQQWLTFRGSAAFVGDFAPDDYPAQLARVRVVSPVPDPIESPYADCLTEIEIEPYDFKKGVVGEPFIGVITAFRKRELTPEAVLKPGDILHCAMVPEDHISEDIKKIQRVSTIEDLTLDTKYLSHVARLGSGEPKRVTITTYENPYTRTEEIVAAKARINGLLARNGGDWKTWYEQTQKYRDQINALLIREEGEITLDQRMTIRSMWHIDHVPNQHWPAPQLAVLKSMNEQLRAWGIDLIVVPIPEKEATTWVGFLEEHPPDDILNPYRQYLMHEILNADIEVIDLAPAFRRAWEEYEHVYYDGGDGHPADGAIQVAAEAVARRLARYKFTPRVTETWRIPINYRIPSSFHHFPDSAMTEDRYVATRIMTMDLRGIRDSNTNDSPILMLSDSFGSVPMEYRVRNANSVAHISARVGLPIRHKQAAGGGPKMLRYMAGSGPELLKGRKVCVFMFSENYMYRHVPAGGRFNWLVTELPKPDAPVPVDNN